MSLVPHPAANTAKPLFEDVAGDIDVSFEFFPPKTEKMEAVLWESIKTLEPLAPRFVSVTYGAGGSTRARTHATVERIARETSMTAAAHLTCVEASRDEIDEIARDYWAAGVRHIVALRGDSPEPGKAYAPHADGYRNAVDLIAGLKKVAPFEISVAAYPEGHPDSPNRAADLDNLWRKFDAGADRAITQFFFSPESFFRFRDTAAAMGIDAEIVPGILPVSNVAQTRKFAAQCGAAIPAWMDRLFEGLDNLPGARALVAATVAAELCGQLYAGGIRHFHFYTLNRAELAYAICHLLGLRPKDTQLNVAEQLKRAAAERILIKDGAYGTQIQARRLGESDYRGALDLGRDQKGNNDLLNLTRPELIGDIASRFAAAGAEILATNSFNANRISMADYGAEHLVRDINIAAARIIVETARAAEAGDGRRRFVAGALGPTNKTLSLSPDVNDPGFREIDFDFLSGVYVEQIEALVEGGAQIVLIETVFDTLNAKAAIHATRVVEQRIGRALPIMLSMTITDLSGRNLSGHCIEAFWASVRHARPLSIGLNCSFGAAQLRAHVASLSRIADCLIMAYPNAGLPNDLGDYDECPETTSSQVREWAEQGIVNIVGGCCGTTPEHIRAIAEQVEGYAPRRLPQRATRMQLAGIAPMTLAA